MYHNLTVPLTIFAANMAEIRRPRNDFWFQADGAPPHLVGNY